MRTPSVLVLCLVGLCAPACIASDAPPPPAEADAATLAEYEADVKVDIARRLRAGPNWATLEVTIPELEIGGIPVSPYALAAAGNGVYVVDSGRRIVAKWNGESQATSLVFAPKDDESLEVPFDLHARDHELYVMDTTSLRVVDPAVKTTRKTRFFHSAWGFLPIGGHRIVLNVLNPRGDGELILVDEQFATLRTFAAGAVPQVGTRGAYGLASLALCGDGIGVAYRHRPLVLKLDRDLREARPVDVQLPRLDHLLVSDQSVRRRPNEKLGWHPTYFGGIACSALGLFVLLDLPQLRIYQFDLTDRLQRVIGADLPGGGQYSFERLVASASASGFPLYSIVRTPDGKTGVAVIREHFPTPGSGLSQHQSEGLSRPGEARRGGSGRIDRQGRW